MRSNINHVGMLKSTYLSLLYKKNKEDGYVLKIIDYLIKVIENNKDFNVLNICGFNITKQSVFIFLGFFISSVSSVMSKIIK